LVGCASAVIFQAGAVAAPAAAANDKELTRTTKRKDTRTTLRLDREKNGLLRCENANLILKVGEFIGGLSS
jgi:hypothetical protein